MSVTNDHGYVAFVVIIIKIRGGSREGRGRASSKIEKI
jgi:hypothetical protein